MIAFKSLVQVSLWFFLSYNLVPRCTGSESVYISGSKSTFKVLRGRVILLVLASGTSG
uniref:Uncharacterized protein n=1 Tax=uncultured marine virus TaxID=186617 RepID=A0A0F7LC81_9VIRU|nr:hypothetical protein [uncultured marine virus]